LGNSFTLTKTIDWKKLEAIAGENEILIGYPEGLQHTPSFEGPAVDMADLARKLSNGTGPQTWKTNRGGKVQEHYVSGIPARPFLDDGIEAGTDAINNRIKKYYKKNIEDGKKSTSDLHAIAVTAIGEIRKWVISGADYVPNSPTTIEGKGSDRPLIDTGQLLNSITYVIGDTVHKELRGESGKKEWTAT
jgi:hypothetical protein